MANELWTEEELEASVDAYLLILLFEQSHYGELLEMGKSDIRNLFISTGRLSGRSAASFEFRMRNISSVLEEFGHNYISGYLPAKNVGPGPRMKIIESLRSCNFPIDHAGAFQRRLLVPEVLEGYFKKWTEVSEFNSTVLNKDRDLGTSISELMGRVLTLQQFWSRESTPEMIERGVLIRDFLPAEIRKFENKIANVLGVKIEDLVIEGKDGTGGKTEIPWVRFGSKRHSPKPTLGRYCVFLFDSLGQNVYLSLSMGAAKWQGKELIPFADKELNPLALWGASQVQWLISKRPELLYEFDLHCGSRSVARAYESANSIALRYEKGKIPDNSRIEQDLYFFSKLLKELYYQSDRGKDPLEISEEIIGGLKTRTEEMNHKEKSLQPLIETERPVKSLGLTSKTVELLKKRGVWTLGELLSKTPDDLRGIKGFGPFTFAEIVEVLNELNIDVQKEGTKKLLELENLAEKGKLSSSEPLEAEDELSLTTDIRKLGFSKRITGALRRIGIVDLQGVLSISPQRVANLPGIGTKSVSEFNSITQYLNQDLRVQKLGMPQAGFTTDTERDANDFVNVLGRGFPEVLGNFLLANGIDSLENLLSKTEAELMSIPNFGITKLNKLKDELQKRGFSLQKAQLVRIGFPEALGNFLLANGIDSLENLLSKTEAELMSIPNFGITRLNKLKRELQKRGHSLAKDTSEEEAGAGAEKKFQEIKEFFYDQWPLWKIGEVSGLSETQVKVCQNLWLLELYIEKGESYRAIGDRFGITHEAARLRMTRVAKGRNLREERKLFKQSEKEKEWEEVRSCVMNNPGLTQDELIQKTGKTQNEIEKALTDWEKKFVIDWGILVVNNSDSYQVWSQEEILEILIKANTYEHPLTSSKYEELRSIGELKGPTVATIHKRFGGWSSACEEAGVEHGVTKVESYKRNWTDEDIYAYVINYLLDHSTKGTSKDFQNWLKGYADAPSFASIRNYLGGWSVIKQGAVQRIVDTGRLKEL